MTGLRARQHLARADQILDAAMELFNGTGYEATRVEDIAERAAVAPATVYNYYATKPNIILALAERHMRETRPKRLVLVGNPPDDPIGAIVAYEKLLISQCQQVLNKSCWRVVFGALYSEPGGEEHRFKQHINSMVRDDFRTLLEEFQRVGRFREDVDAAVLADIIFSIDSTALNAFIRDDDMTPEDFTSRVIPQLELLLRGFVQQPGPSRPRPARGTTGGPERFKPAQDAGNQGS